MNVYLNAQRHKTHTNHIFIRNDAVQHYACRDRYTQVAAKVATKAATTTTKHDKKKQLNDYACAKGERYK